MKHPSHDQPGGPAPAPTGPGIAVQEYGSAPQMQAEMARLNAHGWHVVGVTTREERRGNTVATVLLFLVGWFVLFLTWPIMYWTWPRSSDVYVVTYAMGPAAPSELTRVIADDKTTASGRHWSSSSVAGPEVHRRARFMPWRKATWANIIWNGLMAWLLIGGLQNAQVDERYGVFSVVAVVMAVWFLLLLWFIGSIILAAVWLVSQPKQTTAVYDPQGRQALVTEEEAKRWVDEAGWSYYPQPRVSGANRYR